MTKVIFVPIVYQGRELKAPFLLFVDWTVEQRKRYANDLREVKHRLSSVSFPGIRVHAHDAWTEGKVCRETLNTINGTLAHSGDYDDYFVETLEYQRLWLDMQIGMVDVPTFEF